MTTTSCHPVILLRLLLPLQNLGPMCCIIFTSWAKKSSTCDADAQPQTESSVWPNDVWHNSAPVAQPQPDFWEWTQPRGQYGQFQLPANVVTALWQSSIALTENHIHREAHAAGDNYQQSLSAETWTLCSTLARGNGGEYWAEGKQIRCYALTTAVLQHLLLLWQACYSLQCLLLSPLYLPQSSPCFFFFFSLCPIFVPHFLSVLFWLLRTNLQPLISHSSPSTLFVVFFFPPRRSFCVVCSLFDPSPCSVSPQRMRGSFLLPLIV